MWPEQNWNVILWIEWETPCTAGGFPAGGTEWGVLQGGAWSGWPGEWWGGAERHTGESNESRISLSGVRKGEPEAEE